MKSRQNFCKKSAYYKSDQQWSNLMIAASVLYKIGARQSVKSLGGSTRFVLSVVIFIFVYIGIGLSQNNSQWRLAEAFFRNTNYEQALPIYKKLYNSGDNRPRVINRITKCHLELAQYDSLIRFLETVLQKNPGQINYKISLGSAYYMNGQKDKAQQTWQNVYMSAPDRYLPYRLVGQEMIQLRLYDQAIEVYKKALRNTKKHQSLYRDIGMLYKAQLNYDQAVYYYLKYYQHYPQQFHTVRSHIMSMTKDDEAVQRVIDSMEAFIQQNQVNSDIRELLGGLYIRKKDFPAAFVIYKTLSNEQNSQKFLLRFADEAEKNGAYVFAIKTYELLISNTDNKQVQHNLRFELARNHFFLGRTKFTQKSKSAQKNAKVSIEQALQLLNDLLNTTISPALKAKSFELKGDIYQQYFNESDQAVNYYRKAVQQPMPSLQAGGIHLKLAQTLIKMNNLEQARSVLQRISHRKFKHVSNYYLGEIDYYSGLFSKAKTVFQNLYENIQSDDSLTNNCLEKIIFIENNSRDSTALAQYSRAELLIKQNKLSESASLLKKIFRANFSLSPLAALRYAKVKMNIQHYDDARLLLQSYLDQYPEHDDRDEAKYLLAEMARKQQKWQDALQYYRDIITQFPESFFINEARAKARQIDEMQKQGAQSS
ncbi:MAG: tetratricopeptide repeat protein [Caldithrix sp.]|nr:tetratricopeptide repeat protein [Caldithrix sp.]